MPISNLVLRSDVTNQGGLLKAVITNLTVLAKRENKRFVNGYVGFEGPGGTSALRFPNVNCSSA